MTIRILRQEVPLGAQAGELLVDDLRVRPGLVALLPRRLQLGLRYRHLVEPLEALQFPLVVAQVTARLGPLGLQPRVVGTLGKNATQVPSCQSYLRSSRLVACWAENERSRARSDSAPSRDHSASCARNDPRR